ncbi:MAG: hypothetical protein R3E67_03470 [Pseudomonadales bacterium]
MLVDRTIGLRVEDLNDIRTVFLVDNYSASVSVRGAHQQTAIIDLR